MPNISNTDPIWVTRILDSMKGLQYGVVQIVVHDGKIVQIERTERQRFDDSHPSTRTRSRKEN